MIVADLFACWRLAFLVIVADLLACSRLAFLVILADLVAYRRLAFLVILADLFACWRLAFLVILVDLLASCVFSGVNARFLRLKPPEKRGGRHTTGRASVSSKPLLTSSSPVRLFHSWRSSLICSPVGVLRSW
jgi:hypothetical protein